MPGPGTHPTIQEGLKVTRGRHQVGRGGKQPGKLGTKRERWGWADRMVQEAGGRPLGGWEGAEGGIVFLGEEGVPSTEPRPRSGQEVLEGSQPGTARAQEPCQAASEDTPGV